MTEPNRPGPIHATSIMMVLVLAGISALFLGASAAYIYSRVTTGVTAPVPPWLFYANIPVLFYATRALQNVKRNWTAWEWPTVRKQCLLVLGLTGIFAVLQVIGWLMFFDSERSIGSSQTLSYLFVLSALHLLHVLAGVPFLVVLMQRIRKYDRQLLVEPVKLQRFMAAVTQYWSFLEILWILLVLMLTLSAVLS